MLIIESEFTVGDVIRHTLFGYRGVIVDIDPGFVGTDAWYDAVARTRPPKDRPWYHVLPHDGDHQTYVAERNIQLDGSGLPVDHPLVGLAFDTYADGRYLRRPQRYN